MKSLGVDHGSNRFGWSVFEDGKYFDSGFVTIKDEYPQSLYVFWESVNDLVVKYKPLMFVLEEQVMVQNIKSSAVLFELNGIEKFLCLQRCLPFESYNNKQWKGILGMGRCEKHEIGLWLAEELGIPFEKICVPTYYTKDCKNGKKGDFKEYLCDESDAVGINYAYWQKVKGVKRK
jgi:Holliday junction resolvasome RuvABC endonuclease subunit